MSRNDYTKVSRENSWLQANMEKLTKHGEKPGKKLKEVEQAEAARDKSAWLKEQFASLQEDLKALQASPKKAKDNLQLGF